MLLDEGGVDVVEDVGPDLTDVMYLIEFRDGGVSQRVGCGGGRVWMGTNSSGIVNDILAHDVVNNVLGLVLGPSRCIASANKSKGKCRRTYSANASDQPSPIPPASVVWRQRPVPPPVKRLEIPCVF